MINPMPLVAVAVVRYVNYINLSIYMYTVTIGKSHEKALHVVSLLEEYAECIYYLSCLKLFKYELSLKVCIASSV
jgi:hypothetical protein